MDRDLKLYAAAGAALLVAGLIAKKKWDDAGGLPGVAGAAAETAGRAVGSVATGTVLGVGDAVGLPRTELNACELAIAEGRMWDASFVCPAGRFLEALTSSK